MISRYWQAEIPGRVRGRAEALTGPTTPPGKRVQTINPPGSEVGPGQVATWGRSDDARGARFRLPVDRQGMVQQTHPLRLDRAWSRLGADGTMPAPAPDVARQAYLRLTSARWPHTACTLLASLIAVTAIAWAFTLYQPVSMSVPMGSAMRRHHGNQAWKAWPWKGWGWTAWPAGVGGLRQPWSSPVFATSSWTLMMVAMMLPAAMPMILIFAAAQARRDRHVAIPTWIFVAGYILVWAAAGLVRTYSIRRSPNCWSSQLQSTAAPGRPSCWGSRCS